MNGVFKQVTNKGKVQYPHPKSRAADLDSLIARGNGNNITLARARLQDPETQSAAIARQKPLHSSLDDELNQSQFTGRPGHLADALNKIRQQLKVVEVKLSTDTGSEGFLLRPAGPNRSGYARADSVTHALIRTNEALRSLAWAVDTLRVIEEERWRSEV